MSTNLPPTGPPPSGPPPSGPPPSGPPPGGPEYLEPEGGGPLAHRSGSRRGSGRRTAAIVGGALVGLAALGGGGLLAWAAFFSVGDQPAQALPAGTLGYLSVDLDPSGSQKIEALRTLNKFPAFEDAVGLDADGDIKQRIFEEIQADGTCESLDYGDDIEPWLGDRFAVAAVDLGEDEPAPVVVMAVQDAQAADDGMQKVQECDGGEAGVSAGGWVIEDGWALVAETKDIAEEVADARADGTLDSDSDFAKWTGEAGDAGIVTAYAAPEAGQFIADTLGGTADGPTPGDAVGDPFGDTGVPEELIDVLRDFEGAGVSVRFDDGSLEIESASSLDLIGLNALTDSDQGAEVVGTLPEDTAAAFGVGFEEGWFDQLLEYASQFTGDEFDLDELIAEAEDEAGLELPGDAETLAGESLAVAIGPDVDAETFFNSEDGSDVPVGVKIKGDSDAITEVIDKIVSNASDEEVQTILGTDTAGDYVAVGPNDDYRAKLLKDGDLGDTDVFQDVVREDGVSSVLFVNFDAGDGWLARLAEDDKEAQKNIEPLSGLGVTGWADGDVGHSVLRITTE